MLVLVAERIVATLFLTPPMCTNLLVFGQDELAKLVRECTGLWSETVVLELHFTTRGAGCRSLPTHNGIDAGT